MDENEEVKYKYGVAKDKIEKRIDGYYQQMEVLYREEEEPIRKIYLLETRLVELKVEEANLLDDSSKAEELKKIQDERIEIERQLEELKSTEYVKSVDVYQEIEELLENANPDYSFVEIENIEARIEYYKELLANLGKDNMLKRKSELEEELKRLRTTLEELRKKLENDSKTNSEPSDSFFKAAREKAIKELEEKIANRKAMIAGRGDELHPDRFKELEAWEKELKELQEGKVTPEIIEDARFMEIKDLEEKIAHREAMIAGRGDELHPDRFKELEDWKKRLKDLQNPTQEKNEEDKDKIKEQIEVIEREIEEKEKALKELEEKIANYDEVDTEVKRRVYEHRLRELEEIQKEKQLYKINDKGEIEIKYPPIKPVLDEKAILDEYAYRRTDMLDKFYGNKDRAREYADKLDLFRSHIDDVEFEFVDKDGKIQKGTYETVIPYEGMEKDIKFLQLEEYKERLERVSKAEAGDVYAYYGFEDAAAAREEDEHYLDTFNNAYNRLESTNKNLMTLGKYGEKVPYNKMQEGQPVRNIFRATGNVLKFFRNNILAPINKFVGSKIVAPIHGKITDPTQNVAGLYSNKFSHRYVSRRDYFQEQGDGYFKSRFKAIFSAKEGNKAVLSAGSHDIKQSILEKYQDLAEQEARRKQIEFASKDIEGQIEMITQDLEGVQNEEDKVRLQQTLDELNKAKEKIEYDRQVNEEKKIRQTVQTDAVDLDQHDIANKENVTRVVTGVKMLGRAVTMKFIGPKIAEWLKEHTMIEKTIKEDTLVQEEATRWVDTTYKTIQEPVYEDVIAGDATLQEIIANKAGENVTGFYSVSGGERGPASYLLKGSESITAVHIDDGTKWGTGFSDLVGLKAPTLTDQTFMSQFLDASGKLRQDIKVDEILNLFNHSGLKPEDISFSIGDRCWVKGDELLEMVQKQIGTQPKVVVDVPGHEEKFMEWVTKTVDKVIKVPNERVIKVLNGLGIAAKVTDKALLADDIYENVRVTDTEVDPTKPWPREFDFNEVGFTGKKEEDYKAARRKGTEELVIEEDEEER